MMRRVSCMKNKYLLLFKLFLPFVFLITACGIRDTSDIVLHMEVHTEDMPTEQDMSGDGASEQADSDLGIELGDKIIENASLSYETTNFDEAVDFVNEQIDQHGGQLEYSNKSANASYGYTGDFISM